MSRTGNSALVNRVVVGWVCDIVFSLQARADLSIGMARMKSSTQKTMEDIIPFPCIIAM